MCVGEGGMDPQYFAHTLTLYEAELYCKGLARRWQIAWSLARYQAFYSAAPHCKNFTFEKMGEFPWEKEDENEHLTEEQEEEELRALRARAHAMDEAFLKKIQL